MDAKPKISIAYNADVVVITFADEKILDEIEIRAVEESINSVVKQKPSIKLVLDFCNVQFLSSSVLGTLIRLSKRVYEGKGQLRFCCINPKIYEIFTITRLDKVFDISESLDEAMASFE